MDSNQVIEISGESKDFGNESPKDIKQYNWHIIEPVFYYTLLWNVILQL